MQILILAKSITEANQYARVAGLPRFTYRAVRNAGAIRGIRNAEVHLLSSFLKRPDRHAIMAALRNARTLEVYYVDLADFDLNPTPPAVDQGDGMGEQLDILDALLDSNMLEARAEQVGTIQGTPVLEYPTPDELAAYVPTEEDSEQTAETEPSEDPAPEAPKRRRRTRCKDCEELHFKDESCELDDPLTAPSSRPISAPTPSFF